MIIDTTQTKVERQIEICRRRGWKVVSPETVGAFPIREDITVLPGDSQVDSPSIIINCKYWNEVGIIFINDHAITRIEV